VLAAQLQQQLQAYAATGAGTHATPFAGATHSPPASAGWLTAENSAAAGPLYAGAHHSHPGQGQGDRSGSPPPPHLAASLQPSNARTAGKVRREGWYFSSAQGCPVCSQWLPSTSSSTSPSPTAYLPETGSMCTMHPAATACCLPRSLHPDFHTP
jgi:hypothetical protein